MDPGIKERIRENSSVLSVHLGNRFGPDLLSLLSPEPEESTVTGGIDIQWSYRLSVPSLSDLNPSRPVRPEQDQDRCTETTPWSLFWDVEKLGTDGTTSSQ